MDSELCRRSWLWFAPHVPVHPQACATCQRRRAVKYHGQFKHCAECFRLIVSVYGQPRKNEQQEALFT